MRKIIFLLLTLGLLLAGCALSELSNGGTVMVSIGGDGRYITESSSGGVDEAYLGLIDQDVLYTFDELTNVQAPGGIVQHTFAGVPVGDYTFLAMLMDSADRNIAMALEPVTIEEGLNQLIVEMGPGFTLEIGGLDFELDDLDDLFTVSFSGEVVTIEVEVSALLTTIIPNVSTLEVDIMDTNAQDIEVLDWDGSAFSLGSFNYNPTEVEGDFSNNNTISLTNVSLSSRFMVRMHSWDTTGLYADEKGYKDYKFELVLKV